MIRTELLDALSDDELDQVEVYVAGLKKRRDDDKKAAAIEHGRAILFAAGLRPEDLIQGKRKVNGVAQYKHPTIRRRCGMLRGKSRSGCEKAEIKIASRIARGT